MRRTGKHHPRVRRSSAPLEAAPRVGTDGSVTADSHVRFRSYIPLALPGASVTSIPRLVSVAPEPEVAPELVRAAAGSGAPWFALAASVALFLSFAVYAVRHWIPVLSSAAPAQVAVASPAPPPPSAPAPAPAVGSAVLTGAVPVVEACELARGERAEVTNALDIGDLRRAGEVARRAVEHDPSEADGWLLLVAAEIELHHQEAANKALAACAERATHGPRGECVALMQPNGPEPRR